MRSILRSLGRFTNTRNEVGTQGESGQQFTRSLGMREAVAPNMTPLETHAVSLVVVALVVAVLFRNITAIGKLTTALWVIMFLAVAAVTFAALSRFDPKLAFTYPEGAFHLNGSFFGGLGAAL